MRIMGPPSTSSAQGRTSRAETPVSSAPFRFIHCSDWQLPMAAGSLNGGWRAKQVLSRASWLLRRRRQYRREVLEEAMRVWSRAGVDRVCVSGDLVNFALPAEFAAAAVCLRRIEATAPVSLVPGNHDALVRAGDESRTREWQPWLGGAPGPGRWPSVTLHGPVAFVGLSSAVPTPPFFAHGELAPPQLEELARLLPALQQRGFFRVVMIHHPPQAGAIGWRGALRNAAALREVLRCGGAELVLHGHLHRPVRASLPGDAGPIPVLGAGSASSCRPAGQTARGHFHLCSVQPTGPGAWRLFVTDYFYDPARRRYEPREPEEILAVAAGRRLPAPRSPGGAAPAAAMPPSLRTL